MHKNKNTYYRIDPRLRINITLHVLRLDLHTPGFKGNVSASRKKM
jgi:hypothetical protein